MRARLVTLDAETVEITHEALLHAWPRLRDWIDEDRSGNLLRQRLEEDGRSWEELEPRLVPALPGLPAGAGAHLGEVRR